MTAMTIKQDKLVELLREHAGDLTIMYARAVPKELLTEAADLIQSQASLLNELLGALKALRGNIGCASLVRNPVGKQLRDRADAAIAKAEALTTLKSHGKG